MKKVTTLLISTAIIGSLGIASFAPAAYADNKGPGNGRSEHAEQGERHGRGGPGGFIRLMCSQDGAARLEAAMDRIDDRITLTDEQQALYNDFKSNALAAQTQYADSCEQPMRGADTDIVDRLQTRQNNMKALVSAMDAVIPSFEAYFDSLSEEQKAEMKPKRGKRGGGGKGKRGGGGNNS